MSLYREGSRAVEGITGPLLFVSGIKNGGYGEIVSIETGTSTLMGQVLQVEDEICVIQVSEDTMGLDPASTTVWLQRDVMRMPLSPALKGRVLNGRGEPIDHKGPIVYEEYRLPIQGLPLNPVMRSSPNAYIETGISSIDVMNTLVRGQKLPIFSGAGLPANELATQIVKQARVPGARGRFLPIFAAVGITAREAQYFINFFNDTGAIHNGIFFINLASDSAVERILTPRLALTAAEYFAFFLGYDVLVVITDMLYYCEALREISAVRDEVPGRRGYPGYMYSDLASIFERAGCVKGRKGSVTQLPIITMPGDDMTHPVVDLSGYITEGQIVLDRSLNDRNIYPPINVLPSLSRLMNKGIGKGRTVKEHRSLADQLYASYAKAKEVERLRLIVGEDGLTPEEKLFLRFGEIFEKEFLNQGNTYRDLKQSMEIAWDCLSVLPREALFKLSEDVITEKLAGRERKNQ
ncbi:MAG: V-type ATP synthase beta chain [Thermovirga lienii]|nr:MAG: V-type ATP synthase beta chain [Thermovirga lienii]